MIAFRRRHPVFSRRRFLQASAISGDGLKEIVWLTPEGNEMTEDGWNQRFRALPGRVSCRRAPSSASTSRGRPVKDNNFLLLFNAHHEDDSVRAAGVSD